MSSMKIVTALIVVSVMTCVGLAQRPKPGQQPPAQQPKPEKQQDANRGDDIASGDDALKLGTDLVNVLFTAVDRNNRVVSDIRQDEITVLEDGRPQQIFTFKRETTLPINIAILMELSGRKEYTFPQKKIAAS